MWNGAVSGIYAAPNAGGKMQRVAEVVTVQGKGLEGHFHGSGTNHLVGPEFQVGEVLPRGACLCEPRSHLGGMRT
jgi:hypothetical protein